MSGHTHLNLLDDVKDSVDGRAEGMEIVAVGGPKPEGGDGETAPVTWPQ